MPGSTKKNSHSQHGGTHNNMAKEHSMDKKHDSVKVGGSMKKSSKSKKSVNMNSARCMKCSKMVTVANGKIVNMKPRGSYVGKMLKGTCPVCHTKVCKIVG